MSNRFQLKTNLTTASSMKTEINTNYIQYPEQQVKRPALRLIIRNFAEHREKRQAPKIF